MKCRRKLSCLIIDDELDAIENLQYLLNADTNCNVAASTTNPLEGGELIKQHAPDIVFLDINMPQINGIDALKMLQPFNPKVKFVIISGWKDHVREAMRASAFDYLYKPILPEDLDTLLNRVDNAIKSEEEGNEKKLRIPTKGETVYLTKEDIMLLEANGHYTNIVSKTGEEYMSAYNLGAYEEKLNPEVFKRIGRHAIINNQYLFKMDRRTKMLTLKNNGYERQIKFVNNSKTDLL